MVTVFFPGEEDWFEGRERVKGDDPDQLPILVGRRHAGIGDVGAAQMSRDFRWLSLRVGSNGLRMRG